MIYRTMPPLTTLITPNKMRRIFLDNTKDNVLPYDVLPPEVLVEVSFEFINVSDGISVVVLKSVMLTTLAEINK